MILHDVFDGIGVISQRRCACGISGLRNRPGFAICIEVAERSRVGLPVPNDVFSTEQRHENLFVIDKSTCTIPIAVTDLVIGN